MNLKNRYNKIFGTDSERRAHIESGGDASAQMFSPRLLTGPENEPGEASFLRGPVADVVYDYIRKTYPKLTPEAAIGKMHKARMAALEKARDEIRKGVIDDGTKKDYAAFKEWKEKRKAFEKNIMPTVKGATLNWGVCKIPGMKEKYDFGKFLDRAFSEVEYTPDHDLLVRRTLRAYSRHTEPVLIGPFENRRQFIIVYAPRGV